MQLAVSTTNSCRSFVLKGRRIEALGSQLAASVRQSVKTAVTFYLSFWAVPCCQMSRLLNLPPSQTSTCNLSTIWQRVQLMENWKACWHHSLKTQKQKKPNISQWFWHPSHIVSYYLIGLFSLGLGMHACSRAPRLSKHWLIQHHMHKHCSSPAHLFKYLPWRLNFCESEICINRFTNRRALQEYRWRPINILTFLMSSQFVTYSVY